MFVTNKVSKLRFIRSSVQQDFESIRKGENISFSFFAGIYCHTCKRINEVHKKICKSEIC